MDKDRYKGEGGCVNKKTANERHNSGVAHRNLQGQLKGFAGV